MFFSNQTDIKSNPSSLIKLDQKLAFRVFDKIESVDEVSWEAVLQKRNLFLDLEYLKLIDNTPSTNFSSRYVVIYNSEKPFAIVYFQIIDFKAEVFGEILESKTNKSIPKGSNFFAKYIDQEKDEVIMRLLTCGNNVVSGEHAFLFKDKLVMSNQFSIIEKLIDKIGNKEKLKGKISAILVKDFTKPVKNAPKCFFNQDKYVEFNVEPNMVVDIPSQVNSLTDYIALFSKKYRNRAKSIFKSGSELVVKQLSIKEIQKEQIEIYNLYLQVFDNAKFKLVKLPHNYFYKCKEIFKDSFTVTAFYYKNKMVAFTSGIKLNNECYEAHYIGFDYELNKSLELYQNILYSYINEAIEFKMKRLNLGRTASEIKSTVGAVVQELTCYVKPQNTVSKFILKPFINLLQPGDWIPRNPFKE